MFDLSFYTERRARAEEILDEVDQLRADRMDFDAEYEPADDVSPVLTGSISTSAPFPGMTDQMRADLERNRAKEREQEMLGGALPGAIGGVVPALGGMLDKTSFRRQRSLLDELGLSKEMRLRMRIRRLEKRVESLESRLAAQKPPHSDE